ncbi:MAG: hypothetical protein FK730_01950 [Asgard group archaeon]|nr:hypothetical protein [Asgard group archaeon]
MNKELENKIAKIKNNFVKNIHQKWNYNNVEDCFYISEQRILHNEFEFVIKQLLSNTNSNVLVNTINALEYFVREKNIEIKIWISEIIRLFNVNIENRLNSMIIHFFKSTSPNSSNELFKLLKETKNLDDKYKIIFIFGEIQEYHIETLKILRHFMKNEKDEKIRLISVQVISKLEDSDSLDNLIEVIQEDKSTEVRLSAISALGVLKAKKSIDILIKTLDDEDNKIQAEAAEVLGNMQDLAKEESTNKLIEILSDYDRDKSVIIAVMWALGKFKECKIINTLNSHLTFTFWDETVRETAMDVTDYIHSDCREAEVILPTLVDIRNNIKNSESLRIKATQILKSMCKRKNLELNECIDAVKPSGNIRDQFWEQRNISEIEDFFDKSKSKNVSDLVIMSIYFLTHVKGIDTIDLTDINGILILLNLEIPHSQTKIEFDKLIGLSIVTEFMGGYRLTQKGREEAKELLIPKKEKTGITEIKSGISSLSSRVDIVNKTAFIAYSWDNEDHKKWVKMFADKLMDNGVYTYLDQYFIKLGISIPNFMNNINEVDYILVVCTSNYNEQLKKKDSGAHYEGTIIGGKLIEGHPREQIIPIYREGRKVSPPFLKGILGCLMVKDEDFESEFEKLLKQIYGENGIEPPPLGSPPKFDS